VNAIDPADGNVQMPSARLVVPNRVLNIRPRSDENDKRKVCLYLQSGLPSALSYLIR